MNLFSNLRYLSPNNKPCWERKQIVIKSLEIFPNTNRDTITVSIWLPIDELFACMRFERETKIKNLPQILSDFSADPETFCENFFINKFNIKSNLRKQIKININEIVEEKEFTELITKRSYSRTKYKKKSSPNLKELIF